MRLALALLLFSAWVLESISYTQAHAAFRHNTTLPRPSAGSACLELVPTKGASFAVLHVCGPRRRLLMWGKNSHGQLGRNHRDSVGGFGNPALRPGLGFVRGLGDYNVLAACVGLRHTCVLVTPDPDATVGRVKCFGDNSQGQLGYEDDVESAGDSEGSMEALPFVDLEDQLVLAVYCGATTTCVVLEDGRTLRCFGGDAPSLSPSVSGTTLAPTIPTGEDEEPNTTSPTVSTLPPTFFTGEDEEPPSGSPTAGPTAGATPAPTSRSHHVIRLSILIRSVDVGSSVCVVTLDDRMRCWSLGAHATWLESFFDSLLAWLGELSRELLALLQRVRSVHFGADFACLVMRADGSPSESNVTAVKCWGSGLYGALGGESDEDVPMHALARAPPVDYGARALAKMSTGPRHVCALFTSHELACYGYSMHGESGVEAELPVLGATPSLPIVKLPQEIWDVVAGESATLVLAGPRREPFAFGSNEEGQLGRDDVTSFGGKPGEMAQLRALDVGVCPITNFLIYDDLTTQTTAVGLNGSYTVTNPLGATTAMLRMRGPDFVASESFDRVLTLGPGETLRVDLVFDPDSVQDDQVVSGDILGEYWCNGDEQAKYELPVVTLYFRRTSYPDGGSTQSPSAGGTSSAPTFATGEDEEPPPPGPSGSPTFRLVPSEATRVEEPSRGSWIGRVKWSLGLGLLLSFM